MERKKLHKYDIYMEPSVRDLLKILAKDFNLGTAETISFLIKETYNREYPQDEGETNGENSK